MKLRVIILLIPILVYTTEQIKIPLMIGSKCSKIMCSKAKMKCHKKMANKPANNCEGNSCVNCPLANVFTFRSVAGNAVVISQLKMEYVPLKTDLLCGIYF